MKEPYYYLFTANSFYHLVDQSAWQYSNLINYVYIVRDQAKKHFNLKRLEFKV